MEDEEEKIYEISEFSLGTNQHSKVYSLKNKNTGKVLVVKIFEDFNIANYENESKIVKMINQKYNCMENPFFIMYKDINYNANLFKKPKEVKGGNFECLFYDYLSKLSLIDYIHNANEQIKEIHIQFLTYKLLKAIQKMDSINISHSKINASNIMFDKEFNAKLIHFSEAKITEEKSGLKEDLFQLGKTLAKIFSLGICTSIN